MPQTKATKKEPEKKETAKKTPAPLKLTKAETELVKLYRKADKESRGNALAALRGERNEVEQLVTAMLGEGWKARLK